MLLKRLLKIKQQLGKTLFMPINHIITFFWHIKEKRCGHLSSNKSVLKSLYYQSVHLQTYMHGLLAFLTSIFFN